MVAHRREKTVRLCVIVISKMIWFELKGLSSLLIVHGFPVRSNINRFSNDEVECKRITPIRNSDIDHEDTGLGLLGMQHLIMRQDKDDHLFVLGSY